MKSQKIKKAFEPSGVLVNEETQGKKSKKGKPLTKEGFFKALDKVIGTVKKPKSNERGK